eukprot:m51a1_g8038 hypothetical protein (283) ;mRNA; r:50533-54534
MLTCELQASAHQHAKDHFFTYHKWSLDIMRDTAQSMSKESITEARVKQAQAGKKQKKMKEFTLDNKKIKATSELNIAAIESRSDYVDCPASDFELEMGPVTAAIMWGKLTKESEIDAASKNMDRYSILSEKPVIVNWNELVYSAKTPDRPIHYNLVVNFLLSKARDKFTSLLKSTFLTLKSDLLKLLHGSLKPAIDYTIIHDLLQFLSITELELPNNGEKLMDQYMMKISFEHTDKDPEEHADKHKDSEKPDEMEKPGKMEKPDETEKPEEPEPASSSTYSP